MAENDRRTGDRMITLATLPDSTAQEVFDYIAKHLLTQGDPSNNIDGDCLYLNKEGLKCAAGCLMSSEEYRKEFEGKPWDRLVAQMLVPSRHCVLIKSLQAIHDSFDPAKWRQSLKETAAQFDLEFNL